MRNDTDLQILVSLLSYLKKHDDVATRLSKREPPYGYRDPEQMKRLTALGPPNKEFDPQTLRDDMQSRTADIGGGTPGSIDTTSGNIPEVSETPSSEIPSSKREYDAEGYHTGERKGTYFHPGERKAGGPEVTVVSPSDDPSDATDYITDEENEILQWFQDENWSLPDIKQLLEDCTAPSTRVKKSFNKPNEYPLLKLFKRLGI